MQRINSKTLAQTVLLPILGSAKCVVDATAGNGHDTVFLAQHTSSDAAVWAFDIQRQALDEAAKNAAEAGCAEKVHFVQASHSTVGEHISEPIDAAMFNLGYLPGASHAVTTVSESTREAIAAIMRQLRVGGMITVVSYSGHEEGKQEQDDLFRWFKEFPVSVYTVSSFRMINHKETAPMLFLIEKVRDDRL